MHLERAPIVLGVQGQFDGQDLGSLRIELTDLEFVERRGFVGLDLPLFKTDVGGRGTCGIIASQLKIPVRVG